MYEIDNSESRPRKRRAVATIAACRIGATVPDLTEALPIIVCDGVDARGIGLALSAVHAALAQAGVSNVDVVKSALHLIRREASPYAKMALDLASQADAMGWRNPYHNADHLREVTVNMANLGALNATRNEGVVFDKDDLTIAIALAVSHDLGHDGSTNCVPRLDQKGSPVTTRDGKPELVNVPFLLEDKAIASINIAGRRAGVPEARLRQMRAAILTTDERTGYEILDVVLDPMPNPAKRGALLALRSDPAVLNDPKSLRLATMLRDADLMNSCGISAVDSDRQTARLEQERGLKEGTLRGSGTEYFLGTIARGRFLSPEGQIFQGNLTYPRELNRIRLQTAGLTPVSLAQIEAACNSRSFPGRRARLGRRRLQAAVILSGVIRPCGADAHSNGITNGGGAPWRRPFLPIDYPIAKWRTGYHWLGRRRTFSGYS